MKVFISCSGTLSYSIGEALGEWISTVIQAVDPFVSSKNIDKGTQWPSIIHEELETTNYGIICVTPDNTEAPWLLFEAGALSKLDNSRVVPFLADLSITDLKGPLTLFQSVVNFDSKEEVYGLVKSINEALESEERKLGEKLLEASFRKWWPELEAKLTEIVKTKQVVAQPEGRDVHDMVEEILQLTRFIAQEEGTRKVEGILSPVERKLAGMAVRLLGEDGQSIEVMKAMGDLANAYLRSLQEGK